MKLPKTVTETRFIVMSPDGMVLPSGGDMSNATGWICLGSKEIIYEVPQDDPLPKLIVSLENRAEDIQAEATAAVRMIMDQIKQLQCLEHNPGGDV